MDIVQYPQLTTNNILVVGIRTSASEVIRVSFYFEPYQPIAHYLDHLRRIRRETAGAKVINLWWGSTETDHRGDDVAGAIAEMGLEILNIGAIPTFDTVRGGRRYSSYVDITTCSTGLLNLVDN